MSEWHIQDRYCYLDTYRDIRLRYTGLTDNASVMLAEKLGDDGTLQRGRRGLDTLN